MPLTPLSEDELKTIADRLTVIACAQRDTSTKFRQPKLDKILKAEELYFNVVARTLKGRFNIPLPILSGFVDALLSKIDDEIEGNFDPTEDADKIKTRKTTAMWKYDSAPNRGRWTIKDLLTKKLAIFSGVGINMIYSESDPVYKNHLSIIDAFDFHCESTAGYNIEDHLFCGVDNIFRTKSQVEKATHYDKDQVATLMTVANSDEYKKNQEIYANRANRFKSLGLDIESNSYTGVTLFNFSQWNMYDNETGRRFYLLFEPLAKTWVRIAPLEEITGEPEKGELPKYMFKAWHTHPDAWNFWGKAPVDDVVPIAVAIKAMVNFMFDEVQKYLWGQRIYDPEIIQDPSQLEWDRPDKLIQAYLPAGKKLSDGVYQIPFGDKSHVTINMVDYFRQFVAVESGITPQAKGESDEKLLGIAEINQGEVADRLGLTNKWYRQFYVDLCDAWLSGLQMCLTDEKQVVRMIGEQGVESADLTKEDMIFVARPNVRLTGGRTEAKKNEMIQQAKTSALVQVINVFPDKINAKVAIESLLSNGHWKQDEIAPLLDVNADFNEDESVFASQAIQDILEGKKPELYQGATTRFIQKIIDFAVKRQTNPVVTKKLMSYALLHMGIADANTQREEMLKMADEVNKAPIGPGETPGAPAGGPGAPVLSPMQMDQKGRPQAPELANQ